MKSIFLILCFLPLFLDAQKGKQPIIMVDLDYSEMMIGGRIEDEFFNQEKEKFRNEKKWRWEEWLERWEVNKKEFWSSWLQYGLDNQKYQLKPKFITKGKDSKKEQQIDFTIQIKPRYIEWILPTDTFPPVLFKADIVIKDATDVIIDTFIAIDSALVQSRIKQSIKNEQVMTAGILFGVIGAAIAASATGTSESGAIMVPHTEEDLVMDNYYYAGQTIGKFCSLVMWKKGWY